MRLYKILVLLLLSCSTYAQWGPAQNSYQRIKGVWPFERLKLPSDTSATKEANTIVAVGNKLWLSNGTYYIDVTGAGGLGGVTSFNTRTGAVSLIANDVNVALGFIPVSPSDTASMLVAYARLTRFIDSCGALRSAINAIGTPPVSSVFGRTGAITAQAGDYSAYYPSISRLLDSTDAVWSRVQAGYQPVGSYLVAGNNLADVTNIATARTNLSVYSQSEVLQRITDSLRALVRLRASGSGGIDLQNSSGTSVATFGSAGTTNGSIAGGWNVGGNSTISGTLGVTQKATFSDSIVGVNQRLSGNIQAATFNGSALGSYAFRSSGLAELSGATFTGAVGSTSFGVGGAGYDRLTITHQGTYSRIQSFNAEPLSLNPLGNNVGIGTTSPNSILHLQQSNLPSITLLKTGVISWFIGNPTQGTSNNFSIGTDAGGNNEILTLSNTGAATFSGALTATAQGNNIAYTVDSTTISTSNYTLVAGDASKRFYIKNSSSALTVTIPTDASVNFPIGTEIIFFQDGTGDITISGASGVTVKSGSGLTKLGEQYAFAGVVKLSANTWGFTGNRK